MIYIAPKSRRNQGACGCWMEFSESNERHSPAVGVTYLTPYVQPNLAW